jgi:hypothetical protein
VNGLTKKVLFNPTLVLRRVNKRTFLFKIGKTTSDAADVAVVEKTGENLSTKFT